MATMDAVVQAAEERSTRSVITRSGEDGLVILGIGIHRRILQCNYLSASQSTYTCFRKLFSKSDLHHLLWWNRSFSAITQIEYDTRDRWLPVSPYGS